MMTLTPNPNLTLALYCCPTGAHTLLPPICLRPDKPRADTPTTPNRQALCRYVYEPDLTSLCADTPTRTNLITVATDMPCDPTSPRAVTPTNLITCHADMPVTRIRLGRAWLPRYTAEPAAEAARTCR